MRKGENFSNVATKLIALSGGTIHLKIMNFFWNVFQYNQRICYIFRYFENYIYILLLLLLLKENGGRGGLSEFYIIITKYRLFYILTIL